MAGYFDVPLDVIRALEKLENEESVALILTCDNEKKEVKVQEKIEKVTQDGLEALKEKLPANGSVYIALNCAPKFRAGDGNGDLLFISWSGNPFGDRTYVATLENLRKECRLFGKRWRRGALVDKNALNEEYLKEKLFLPPLFN